MVKFLATSVPWPYPADGAFTYYRDVALPAIERAEQWHWTLRLVRSPEELIGTISLFSKGWVRHSRILVGAALARSRPDDGGGDRC